MKDTKLLHLSFRNNLEGVWQPKLPDGDYENKPVTKYSEPGDIKRISVSTSIDGCLVAIFPNVDKLFEKYPHLDFFIYEPDFTKTSKCDILTSEDLVKKRYVHDAHVTDEFWLLDKCYMALTGSITVKAFLDKKWRQYRPFNDPKEPLRDIAPEFKILKRSDFKSKIKITRLPSHHW